MKHILVSADSNPSVYLVPDIVAENLDQYCLDFIHELYDFANDREFEITDNNHTPSEQETGVCYDEKVLSIG